ncbi:MAG: hypothetical protein AAF799_41745 [Myxococcota bacterium]
MNDELVTPEPSSTEPLVEPEVVPGAGGGGGDGGGVAAVLSLDSGAPVLVSPSELIGTTCGPQDIIKATALATNPMTTGSVRGEG